MDKLLENPIIVGFIGLAIFVGIVFGNGKQTQPTDEPVSKNPDDLQEFTTKYLLQELQAAREQINDLQKQVYQSNTESGTQIAGLRAEIAKLKDSTRVEKDS